MTDLLEPTGTRFGPPEQGSLPPPPRTGVARRSAVVIGAGLGGLALALRLQNMGYATTVVEKNSVPGGRCNRYEQDGFRFDTGPTLLLMRDVLERLFHETGHRLDDELELVRMKPNYRIHFADGASLLISSDVQEMRDGLERFEAGAGDAFVRFLADAGYKYRVSRDKFVERNFTNWGQFLTPGNLPRFFDTGALRRLGPHLARYFHDPRLQIAFSFQSMYLGIAPRDAPAVYSLLPYTELTEGIWYPMGGMYAIVEALVRVLERDGGVLRCNAEVTHIDTAGGRARGVMLADGTRVGADLVVCNADLPWAYDNLLDDVVRAPYSPAKLERLRYGSSALMLYLGVKGAPAGLIHHNVYIGADVRQNFDDIFKHPAIPHDPALYVNLSSRTDPSLAPAGHDTVYVLAPAPLAGTAAWQQGGAELYRERILDGMRHFGMADIRERIVSERLVTPSDWARDYNLRKGATFGIAHDIFQVGIMRPANRHRSVSNLYFVGASTQPGGGIPMVFLGARLVAERVAAEIGLGSGH
ncbi:MAG: phytoene desaturase family protein [Candidatus Dormibacteria bacterium]